MIAVVQWQGVALPHNALKLASGMSVVLELRRVSKHFATHPAVDARVAALVKFAGGHDPGPIEIAPPPQPEAPAEETDPRDRRPLPRPDRVPETGRPFLPDRSPLADPSPGPPGPWGPHQR